MDGIRIISGLATQGAFEGGILSRFEQASGYSTHVTWNPTTVLMKAIAAGERADVCVLTDVAVEELAQQGIVDGASRVDLAQALMGLAVRSGDPHPDISTIDGFRLALLNARSVAISQAGASGIYSRQMFDRLQIAEAVMGRATVIPAGFTAEKLVTGEADLAIQQLSELMLVDGVEIVGPFPVALQSPTTFTAALFSDCRNRRGAEMLLEALTSSDARNAYLASGLATDTLSPV